MNDSKTIILAAGEGTRMRSQKPKVLHQVCGENILDYVIEVSKTSGISEIAVIVGFQAELVKESLPPQITTYFQKEQLGTGHAVLQALPFFEALKGNLVVLVGDAPLIQAETLTGLVRAHESGGYAVTVLTAEFDEPTGYGRMIKNRSGELLKIVEEKDANLVEKQIKEINSGMYCFDAQALVLALAQLKTDNVQGEYYLTDVIEILREMGKTAGTFVTPDPEDIQAINSRVQLAEAEAVMRKRINHRLMDAGVTIIDPATTYVGARAIVGQDTVLYPSVILEGETEIGKDCVIGANCRLVDAKIGNKVSIQSSTILESRVDDYTNVGPYAYIRPGSQIGKHCKVGDFVEVKNSTMGDGAKASHLTYIGDGDVGENVNLGCGTVFVNYDGKNKYRTIVEKNAFVGCNTNLIAPVTVKEGAYIAAGSTITDDVPEDSLAIARARQVNKVGYLKK
ncbi:MULTISPECIES: bifunctional UDP-N-acetylglucosamine diphosphorylase/glucosamine-1-phosphate N-acetyltransferase GlmU [unclassified Acetobacterium]|uniref:bifunctional UDP-N-acetylglucosamine diphosphorylase/glucosamine-1-phosphate N-acetyltransferase GlmU n=1 Tax=unclassified Acetobacterium TaxID=2638182 RepID=UPI000DBEC060|nr:MULTISPECIES: bifunctional UDP-N-acetylglucosamine diphosphorylase/glucosamine-1-phosphate N-acetyltransferase GlmU [unclassified Acetobacterium]AWW26826.1 bifunctional UDP-N-acetylglucosamine diphosphorylase/glucosamine-1-phosphate N-acetyltransferase GlmU [Acetobacterium sp. KB-1]MDZ5725171.1 bifunctional UDP-N-acetylglucosamine diphosphorylase/glucosamine-1-phosphate N-acetyltransferase GlmU [Acetobacterium sp. K1/6]